MWSTAGANVTNNATEPQPGQSSDSDDISRGEMSHLKMKRLKLWLVVVCE